MSGSSIAAQSDVQIEATAVPVNTNHTLGTAVPDHNDAVESSNRGAEAVADVAQPERSLPRSAQATASPSPDGNTISNNKADTSTGLSSCEGQLAAFGTICGLSNQQMLQGFLQSIFQHQEVSDCESILRAK